MPYWYNLTTRQVEENDDPDRARSADLMGPYDTEAEAAGALEQAQANTEAWDAEDREWEEGPAASGTSEAPQPDQPQP